jgi:hypothetical protein
MSLRGLLMRGHPAPRYRSSRAYASCAGLICVAPLVNLFIYPLALDFAYAVLTTLLCLLLGVFSRGSFFFLCRFRAAAFEWESSYSKRAFSSRLSVPFRRVAGLALAGGCCSWSVRPSSRSFSGSVVWAVFASRFAAAAFALACSRLVGFAVAVRPGVCSVSGSVWVVSVPVAR